MLAFLEETFHRLLDDVQMDKHRYLFEHYHLRNRVTGIVGPRGVGKTTLMLQYIKEKFSSSKNLFYVSADHIYFSSNTLLGLVDTLYQKKGVDHLFIDEIHKYPDWNQELKNIYDSFPKVKIAFSGSSSLDLVKGSYDLSRRAKLFRLEGLSFREYLFFTTGKKYPIVTFQQLIEDPIEPANELSKIPRLKGLFNEYMLGGYYPFELNEPLDLSEKLLNIVDKAIYQDIAKFYNLKTQNLLYFKRILNFFSSIPPGELSIHNLSKNLKIDFKTAEHYLHILSEVGLLRLIHSPDGGSRALQKPDKVFINNTTLLHTLNQALGEPMSIGVLRELFFLQSLKNAEIPVFYSTIGDYQSGKYYFEVGGKNKTKRQIKSHNNSFLVKDDILRPSGNIIPLYLFGFLY